jgi:beta-lactamase superfamily II metal-dependent hydrolase
MFLEIFDVEHGACALITTSNGKRVVIDCGHNATTGWNPTTELIARGIWSLDQLIISNYDEDHVSGFPNLAALIHDPPPLKWSDLRYVFDIKEDCNGKEAIQA